MFIKNKATKRCMRALWVSDLLLKASLQYLETLMVEAGLHLAVLVPTQRNRRWRMSAQRQESPSSWEAQM